jgi:hypothetical protein
MRNEGRRPAELEPSSTLLDGPIGHGDAVVLTQVLPGLDDERFDVAPLTTEVVIDRRRC